MILKMLLKAILDPGTMAHAYDPSTQEAKARGS
jgi:hypothetical protein